MEGMRTDTKVYVSGRHGWLVDVYSDGFRAVVVMDNAGYLRQVPPDDHNFVERWLRKANGETLLDRSDYERAVPRRLLVAAREIIMRQRFSPPPPPPSYAWAGDW